MSQPDEWINLNLPEISTDADASGYGPPIDLPRQQPTPEPQVPAQIAGSEPMLPQPTPQVPVPPGTQPPEWKRVAFFVGVGAAILGAAYYVPRWWDTWRRKK